MSALLPSDDEVRAAQDAWIKTRLKSPGNHKAAMLAALIAAWNRRTAPVGEANKTRNRRLVGFEVYDELAPRTRAIYEDCTAPEDGQPPAASPAEELAQIEAMLSDGQGDDDGPQILPDFEPDATTVAKVEACLHLLEKRRDIIAALHLPSQEDVARVIDPGAWATHQTNAAVKGHRTRARNVALGKAAAILALMGQSGDGWSETFGKHKGWSLSFDGKTFCEDDNPDLWTVYAETGSINDRECEVIGRGKTPLEAINAALRKTALPAPPAKEGR